MDYYKFQIQLKNRKYIKLGVNSVQGNTHFYSFCIGLDGRARAKKRKGENSFKSLNGTGTWRSLLSGKYSWSF